MKLKPYPKMKDSGIEWIGKIPEHWELRKIKNSELFSFSQGSFVDFTVEGKYPVYGSNGAIGFFNEYNVDNAILIGRVGAYAGSIILIEQKIWCTDNTIIVKFTKKINPKFLLFSFTNLDFNRFATKTAQPLITQSILSSFQFCLPPIMEQKQTEIASDEVLFHRQSEPHRTQDIKDTLPYFLGAVKENDLALRQELEKAERDLRLAEISLKEAELLKGSELTQAGNLIEEAKDVGLIDINEKAELQDEKIKLLQKINKLKLEKVQLKFNDNLEKNQEEFLEIEKLIGLKHQEIKAVEKFADELKGYSATIDLQKNRLDSIGLFAHLELDENKCPYCFSTISKAIPSISSMQKTLKNIEKNLQNSTQDRPKLRDKISKLEKEKQELEISLNQKRSDIEAILKSREPLLHQRDNQTRQIQVLARIEFWLENVRLTDEASNLRKDVQKKKAIVQKLRDELNDETKKNKLDSIINRISQNMTKWAKELNLEHSQFPVRFYMPMATLMIDDDKGLFH